MGTSDPERSEMLCPCSCRVIDCAGRSGTRRSRRAGVAMTVSDAANTQKFILSGSTALFHTVLSGNLELVFFKDKATL